MTVTLIPSLRGRRRDPLPQRARRRTLTTTRSRSAEGARGVCGRTWWRASPTRRSAGGWRLRPCSGSLGGAGPQPRAHWTPGPEGREGRGQRACRKGQRDGVIRHPRSASPSQRDFEANPKCHIILDVKYFHVYPEGERQS